MADLKDLFSNLKFVDVQTYIQSGNVIFISTGKDDNIELATKIEQSISANYGIEVSVIVMAVNELNEVVSNNPFFEKGDIDIERLYLTFLKEVPEPKRLEKIKTYDYSPDKFEINGKNVFVYCSGKYRDSKLTNNFFESKLKVAASTRNWKTMLKLSGLSETK